MAKRTTLELEKVGNFYVFGFPLFFTVQWQIVLNQWATQCSVILRQVRYHINDRGEVEGWLAWTGAEQRISIGGAATAGDYIALSNANLTIYDVKMLQDFAGISAHFTVRRTFREEFEKCNLRRHRPSSWRSMIGNNCARMRYHLGREMHRRRANLTCTLLWDLSAMHLRKASLAYVRFPEQTFPVRRNLKLRAIPFTATIFPPGRILTRFGTSHRY